MHAVPPRRILQDRDVPRGHSDPPGPGVRPPKPSLDLRGASRWLVPYLLQAPRRMLRRGGPVRVILCLADHFEPKWGRVPPGTARARVARWAEDYPRLFGRLRDSDGR